MNITEKRRAEEFTTNATLAAKNKVKPPIDVETTASVDKLIAQVESIRARLAKQGWMLSINSTYNRGKHHYNAEVSIAHDHPKLIADRKKSEEATKAINDKYAALIERIWADDITMEEVLKETKKL